MNGWVVLEKGKIVDTPCGSIEVFLTKKELLKAFNFSLIEKNTIARVELTIINRRQDAGRNRR